MQRKLNRFLIFLIVISAFMSYDLNAQKRFVDVTEAAGIKHQFVVYEGLFGGGVCVIDVNKDGNEDLYITGGMNDDVLYLNNGDGTFSNIFEKSGCSVTKNYVTQGVVAADVNRDGWVDLFVTTIRMRDSSQVIPRAENLFFINNGNSTFHDATKEYGLDQLMCFSTGACFGDFNIDGYPDLYVGNYFQGYTGKLSVINDATIVNASLTAKGYLFINKDGKYFEDVYENYKLKYKGFGFGAVFTDFDNDDDLDLFVNHDFGFKAMPDVFLVNEYPGKSFTEMSKELNMDLKINAMGTAIGDYDNDGWFDYYVTNIRFNQFMVNQGIGKPFLEKSKELGMGYISISWGANFADFDHDTDLDLYVSNGDLNPNDVPLADYYFENENNSFTEIAPVVGLNDYGVGRGSVVFDMDNDGDLDILVVNQKAVLDYPVSSFTRLYRNDSTKGNWIKIALKGVDSELNGLGSRVRVVIGKTSMIREIDGGSSHLSQNSTIAHFGLGSATQLDSVIVTWVGGKRQILTNQNVNTLLIITETPSERNYYTELITVSISALLFITFIIYRIRNRKKAMSPN